MGVALCRQPVWTPVFQKTRRFSLLNIENVRCHEQIGMPIWMLEPDLNCFGKTVLDMNMLSGQDKGKSAD
jgi:hypothetical protein